MQALGAFAYDYRWERLYQRADEDKTAALWDPARAPILFYVAPGRADPGGAVPEGPRSSWCASIPSCFRDTPGSRAEFRGGALAVTRQRAPRSRTPTCSAARASWTTGCACAGAGTRCSCALRDEARLRKLELRIAGRGQGPLYVGERTFWSDPRFTHVPGVGRRSSSAIRTNTRRRAAATSRSRSDAAEGKSSSTSVELVPAGDPLRPYRIDGTPRE